MAIDWATRQSNLESGIKMRRPEWEEAAYIQYQDNQIVVNNRALSESDLWDFLGTDDWETLS